MKINQNNQVVYIIDECQTQDRYTFKPIIEKREDGSAVTGDDRSVLGIFEGIFFVPDGESRNGRYYTKLFWESILKQSEIQRRLKELVMYGQIGHKETPVSDEDLSNGSVSHVVVDLWIGDDGLGYGRAIILNTEAGRNLYTYLTLRYEGRKSHIKISSRAAGGFKEETHNGLPVVDENNYYLDTFDVVKDPGFTQTDLNIVKNSNPNVTENYNEMGSKNDMSFTNEQKTEIASIISEAIKGIKNPVGANPSGGVDALVENATLKSNIKSLEEKLYNANESLKIFDNFDPEALAVVKKLVSENNTNFIKQWADLGTPDILEEAGEKMDEQLDILEQYQELDTPENLETLVNTANEKFEELGKYQALGTVESITGALNKIKEITPKLEKIGDLDTAIQALESTKIKLPILISQFEGIQKKEINKVVKEIASKFDQPLESVRKNVVKLGEKETYKLYSQIAENKQNNNTNTQESKPSGSGNKTKTNESVVGGILNKINGRESTVNEGMPLKIWGAMSGAKK